MDRDTLIGLLFEKGKKHNVDDMEAYIIKDSSIHFNIYENHLEKYLVAEEESLSLRGIYNGKMGYSYTEKLTPESLEELINNLIQYAKKNDSEDIEVLDSPTEEIETMVSRKNFLDKYTEKDKMKYLFDLEKKAYSMDKRVKTLDHCSYTERTQGIYIKNTKGLELEDTHRIGEINLSVVAQEGKEMQTGYNHHVFNNLSEEYKDMMVKDSVGDATAMLGAKSIETGNYEVILRNNVAAELFSCFSPVFLGNMVQKNLSLMKGKLGSQVAVEALNIKENPILEDGKYCRTFDDEGTRTYPKYLIEKGVLKTFLHNKKTAQKEGITSTGNGFKASHKDSIEVAPTNLYIIEGDKSLEDMMKSMSKGIIITSIHGLHAGIHSISGDFSLSSNGLFVEGGKVVRPLAQITVAGNLYTMLKDIMAIGNDTKFCHPSSTYFGSPSLLIRELTISGK